MSCPDELTLDLYLADALPADEAAVVAAHVRACATCAPAVQAARARDAGLAAALALDADERAHLASLDLPARWRAAPSDAPAWGWLALLGAVGGYLAWLSAAPLVGPVAATAFQIGLGTLPLYLAVDALVALGQGLFTLAANPVLGLTTPLLALVALALLLWPRQSTPQRSAAL